MSVALFHNENTKLYRRGFLWIEMGVIALIVVFINITLAFAVNNPNVKMQGTNMPPLAEMITWPTAANNGGLAGNIIAAGALGGLLVSMLAAFVAAQEYAWRTLHLSVSRGISRGALILNKFAALLPSVALLVAFTWVVNLAITAAITLIRTGSLPFAALMWDKILLSALLTTLSLLPYLALAFLLAVLTRSTIAAAGIVVGFTFLGEPLLSQVFSLLGGWLTTLASWLPSGLNAAMFTLLRGQPVAGIMPAWQAMLGLALYVIVFIAAAVAAFRRQDLTA